MEKTLRTDDDMLDGKGLGRRLDEIAWACILVLTGGLWLVPETWAPEGTWLAGFGLVLIGLEAMRFLLRHEARGFGLVIGAVASAAGIGRMLGYEFRIVPVLLIALGTVMVLRAVARSIGRDGTGHAALEEEGR
jgi:hypothetical protein